ncbi:MAG: hypothetical protein Q7S59_07030, partial [Sulfurimonas sp.]|nr:hypothetical protein [Sulfurimonas sp.]
YKQEPIVERALEIVNIAKVINSEQVFKTVQDRTPVINFSSQQSKQELNSRWLELQKINRAAEAPNRDFMNASAVKFNGVSKEQLDKWSQFAKDGNQVDSKTVDQFVEASLRNAKELEKVGIMKEIAPQEYKFVDAFAKESLYKNLDKTVEQIQVANQGKTIEVEQNPKAELQERVQSISSEKSFENLLDLNGQIDSQKLHAYAKQLESLATQLHTQNNAITKYDLSLANQPEKAQGAENAR